MLQKYFLFLNLSLLLLHEMDAIRNKEWNMFVGLNSLKENTAYIVFSILHLPIYFISFMLIVRWNSYNHNLFILGISIFLVLHGIAHFAFKFNQKNEFNTIYSQVLIYSMSFIAVIQIALNLYLS